MKRLIEFHYFIKIVALTYNKNLIKNILRKMKTKIDKTMHIKYEFEHYKCLDINYK